MIFALPFSQKLNHTFGWVKQTVPLLLILLLGTLPVQASHIVGGEIYYECLGNDEYLITMKIYRDCYNGVPGFDNPAVIGVFDSAGILIKTIDIHGVTITNLPVVLDNPCLLPPPHVCVEEGVYTYKVTLPARAGGYLLAYQRCCRNNTIINLYGPGNQGATYVTYIPDPALAPCNSSPHFNYFPPVAICKGDPLAFDHSAVDADGDSLVYHLCTPLDGQSSGNSPVPPPSPPYLSVIYSGSYSWNKPLPSNPSLAIDPHTGLITGKPTGIGQFVVGICVDEYRNGILINTLKRDFQFNVANCDKVTHAEILVPNVGDTSINECTRFTINFGNKSTGATNYFWDFGVKNMTSDTSIGKYPTFTYPDTGIYRVMLIADPGTPCNDTDFVTVKVFPTLQADFAGQNVCANIPVNFTDQSVTNYGTLTSWNWDFADGNSSSDSNPTHLYSKAGTYLVTMTVTNSIGCRAIAKRSIKIYPIPDADFEVDGNCLFQQIDFFDKSTAGSDQVTKWAWLLEGGAQIDTTPDASYIFNAPGNYEVTLIAISSNGCSDTVSKIIEVLGEPDAVAWGDTTVCIGEPVQLYGAGGKTYTWGASDGTLNTAEQNPMVAPKENTTYIFTGSNDCYYDTAQVHVEVFPPPDINVRHDTSIFHGQKVRLYASSIAGRTYEWQPANGTADNTSAQMTVAPAVTTTYTVTTVDVNGCRNSGEVIIYLRPICDQLYIPNAFSPNGDGHNDYFAPIDYGQNELEEMRVYNRWGKVVCRTNNFEQGWDGTTNGKEQGIGAYVYIIEGTCEHTPVRYTGEVILLR